MGILDWFRRKPLNTQPEAIWEVETPDGLSLYPFQEHGVKWMCGRKRAILGDEMGCISGDAVIIINRGGSARKITLRDAYLRFNHLDKTKRYKWSDAVETKTASVINGELRLNTVKAIIYSGVKKVLQVTTKGGKKLKLTPDHEVLGSDGVWGQIGLLEKGNGICVNGQPVCSICGSTDELVTSAYAKYVGFCRSCVYRYLRNNNINNGKFIDKDGYVRVTGMFNHHRAGRNNTVYEHILVYEEHHKCKVTRDNVLHHLNGIRHDNRIENLYLTTSNEHQRIHGNYRNFKTFIPKIDYIEKIEELGEEDVYDIVMDEPGRNFVANGIIVHNCGKTVQIAGVINTLQVKPILIVCPATIKLNWQIELNKWLTQKHSIQVLSGKSQMIDADITIINYDILDRFDLSDHWGMVVCDEAHYLKNPKTKRYKTLFNNLSYDRLYLVTGTPITNRPVELWPLLKQIDKSWSNYKWFTSRYCNAQTRRVSYDRYIRDVSGASNLDELHHKIKPIMLRRLRKDVLSELPDKTRQIISLPANGASKIILDEQAISKRKLSHLESLESIVQKATSDIEFARAVNKLESYLSAQFVDMAAIRHDLGIAKVRPAIEHINTILDADEKVVAFAHHRDVISMLACELPGALIITGSTPNAERQRIVEEFQTNPAAKVLIGNIKAAGVGITLTAAHHVVFVELDWTPGNMSQAEDRVVRIGQKNNVLVQYLVFDGSLDARIAKILSWKQDIINKAIEGKR